MRGWSVTTPAPIAFFTFNRPAHTARSLDALSQSIGFEDHPLVIYCDGPKGEKTSELVQTRAVALAFAESFKAEVVVRDHNLGCAPSIVAGVGELCRQHGSVIVVEDDLVVSPSFLAYMGQALEHYRDCGRVMQVAGHSWIQRPSGLFDAYISPIPTAWGWATWWRAWESCDWNAAESGYAQLQRDPQLRRQFDLDGCFPFSRMLGELAAGSIDSWAILWWWHVFRSRGEAVCPNSSLVYNAGVDGSGAHGRRRRLTTAPGSTVRRLQRTSMRKPPPLLHTWRLPPADLIEPGVQAAIGRSSLARGYLRGRDAQHWLATLKSLVPHHAS